MSRKRRIIAAAVGLSLVATCAMAYLLGEVVFQGEGTDHGATTETKAIPMTVTFSGVPVVPGVTKSAKLSINNTTGHPLFAHKLEWSISTGNESACPKTWFAIVGQHEEDTLLLEGKGDTGGSNPVYEIAVGEGSTTKGIANTEWQPQGGDILLTEKEEPVNQAGCAGVPIHVKVEVFADAT